MTAATAPWWFLAIVASIGVALVVVPGRGRFQVWRHDRSVQGRLERAGLVAGHLAVKLTRDPVFLGDLALAVAQCLDELDVARVAGAPQLPDLELLVGVEMSRDYRSKMNAALFTGLRPEGVAGDLNDGYRS